MSSDLNDTAVMSFRPVPSFRRLSSLSPDGCLLAIQDRLAWGIALPVCACLVLSFYQSTRNCLAIDRLGSIIRQLQRRTNRDGGYRLNCYTDHNQSSLHLRGYLGHTKRIFFTSHSSCHQISSGTTSVPSYPLSSCCSTTANGTVDQLQSFGRLPFPCV